MVHNYLHPDWASIGGVGWDKGEWCREPTYQVKQSRRSNFHPQTGDRHRISGQGRGEQRGWISGWTSCHCSGDVIKTGVIHHSDFFSFLFFFGSCMFSHPPMGDPEQEVCGPVWDFHPSKAAQRRTYQLHPERWHRFYRLKFSPDIISPCLRDLSFHKFEIWYEK